VLAEGAATLALSAELPEGGAEIGAAEDGVGRETEEHEHERYLG
jgi:hypothetical protein